MTDIAAATAVCVLALASAEAMKAMAVGDGRIRCSAFLITGTKARA
jgi:hypothetical protein